MGESVWHRLTQTFLTTIVRGGSAHEIQAVRQFIHTVEGLSTLDAVFIRPVFEHLYNRVREVRVQELADLSELSLRQFERRFKALVGLPPKRIARFIRFEAARDALLRAGLPHPNAIAHEFGYTDESHFIRDFKAFAACTPNDFIQRAIQRSMTGFYKTPDLRSPYALLHLK